MAAMVDVYCKLPHGLELQLQRKESRMETGPGGAREVFHWVKFGRVITIAGAAVRRREEIARPFLSGYAVTKNVPADFWDAWLEQNRGLDAVERGFIFANKSAADAKANMRDADEHTGLEPMDPKKLLPEFKRKVTKADVA